MRNSLRNKAIVNRWLACYALSGGIAAALLAACGGSQQIGAPGAVPQSRASARTTAAVDRVLPAWSYSLLHRFDKYTDMLGEPVLRQ